MRRALPVLCLWIALMAHPALSLAASVCRAGDGQLIREVCLHEEQGAPTYGHEILGNTPEWDALSVVWGPRGKSRLGGASARATLSQASHIFEDIHPRLIDLDSDGFDEIVVVQTSFSKGARLVVLGTKDGLKITAQTPYIGRANRWLAPLGAADLDGDGLSELAYIDRPHLAKTLRIWRYENQTLIHVADQPDLTNHRIGVDDISGGIRTCAGRPEIVTTNGNRTRMIASTLENGHIKRRDIGPHTGPASYQNALTCR